MPRGFAFDQRPALRGEPRMGAADCFQAHGLDLEWRARRRSRPSRSPPRPPSRLRPREGAADLTTVYSCTLFNAPCEVHSETSERKVCAPIDRSRQSPCTAVFRARMKVGTVLSAQALREIAQVEAEIDR